MTLGTSLFLVALGAILRYAVTDSVEGINLATTGLILMVIGVIGAIVGLLQLSIWSRGRRDRTIVRER